MLMHPWHIDDIKDNTLKAIRKAIKLFGSGSLHNGTGDAFRHCYWPALLTRDIGKDNAKAYTTAHESRAGNPKNEKDMDLHNNQKGIEIGRINPNASDGELAMK